MNENEFFNAQNYEEVRDMPNILPGARPNMLPANKPQLQKQDALALLAKLNPDYKVKLLGIRGYFKKTMGDPNSNDFNLYDDAIFIVSDDHYSSWNANTDPSRHQKGVAVLKAGGPYLYKIGLHGVSGPNPYEALRQYGRVTVIREGQGEETDTARSPFYIDIHRGGYSITSSLGCQTIHPDQWYSFLKTVKTEMKAHHQDIIPYYLVEY